MGTLVLGLSIDPRRPRLRVALAGFSDAGNHRQLTNIQKHGFIPALVKGYNLTGDDDCEGVGQAGSLRGGETEGDGLPEPFPEVTSLPCLNLACFNMLLDIALRGRRKSKTPFPTGRMD